MLNKHLQLIASLVKPNSIVIDVGTDHALLPIYLIKKNICKKVIATDISPKVIKNAKKNIENAKVNNIFLYCTDGIKNVNEKFDTLVISGMGTNTIINILNDQVLPNNIILSSNNNLKLLRKYMNQRKYRIVKEVIAFDKNKYYDVINYEKGIEDLSYKEYLFGKSNDNNYYTYLYNNNLEIIKKTNFKNKIRLYIQNFILKKYLNKK